VLAARRSGAIAVNGEGSSPGGRVVGVGPWDGGCASPGTPRSRRRRLWQRCFVDAEAFHEAVPQVSGGLVFGEGVRADDLGEQGAQVVPGGGSAVEGRGEGELQKPQSGPTADPPPIYEADKPTPWDADAT